MVNRLNSFEWFVGKTEAGLAQGCAQELNPSVQESFYLNCYVCVFVCVMFLRFEIMKIIWVKSFVCQNYFVRNKSLEVKNGPWASLGCGKEICNLLFT